MKHQIKWLGYNGEPQEGQVVVNADNSIYYNTKGEEEYIETIFNQWRKYKYDSDGNIIKYEDSAGMWYKATCQNGKKIYFLDSDGNTLP